MQTLFTNIKSLLGVRNPAKPLRGADLKKIEAIENAFLLVENGMIADFGTMETLSHSVSNKIDCSERILFPAYCDSHTHIVFAGSRENEFVQKIEGKTYTEIAASGGGILNSAHKLQNTPEEVLFETAKKRLEDLIQLGTGAIEIKSGYGLTLEAELKMLRVIRKLREVMPIPIKATFLAAHTFPLEYKDNEDGYIQLIVNEMLPKVAEEGLADFVDVFCEKGFFSRIQMGEIVRAAQVYGLVPKLHVNQLKSFGGLQKAIELNALSVDHLEKMTYADCIDLANSNTIGTLLPTAAYFLRMPFQPARELIDGGAAIALASDFNPGSSPSGNMNLVISMSCIQMKMLPTEALNAATINGAFAMDVQNEVGSIAKGKRANLILSKPIPSFDYWPYAFGSNLIENVYINGVKQ